jgi:hypothetical protein
METVTDCEDDGCLWMADEVKQSKQIVFEGGLLDCDHQLLEATFYFCAMYTTRQLVANDPALAYSFGRWEFAMDLRIFHLHYFPSPGRSSTQLSE